ncbi:MAG: HD domain-containing protein [bacterium]
MNQQVVITKVKEIVQQELGGDGSGHDWWHIFRVWTMAKRIGQIEKAEMFIVELAALLHDIADWKDHGGDTNAGPKRAREILSALNVQTKIINQVADIIVRLSFKGIAEDSSMHSLEGQVVQDADRLDAIGAMGISRTFAYGGSTNRLIYDPNNKQFNKTKADFINHSSPSINHFYEKLLLLKDLMNTATAKEIAIKRHQYMENFLEEFYGEWEGRR